MLQPFMHVLSKQRIILASGSPRRKLILENIGLQPEIIPSSFEENADKSSFNHCTEDYVKAIAEGKALEVLERVKNDKVPPDLIIGADTVVTVNDKIYEKPKDKEDAFRMLSDYSGKSHFVHSAVFLVFPQRKTNDGSHSVKVFHECTEVQFDEFTPEIMREYIATGEPMDKAGAFGIQGIGGTLIKGVIGDYFNVMGFPVHKFTRAMCEMYT